jgi:hypothetical protein
MQAYKYILELRKTSKIKIATTSSLYAPTGADEFCKNINEHKPAINSYGDYIFCCDTIGRGAVLGSLKKKSFSKLFKKGEEKALWLKEERRKRILSKDFFTGFNSCHFCNLLLEKQIIKQKEYQTENKNPLIIKPEEISLEDRLKKII